MRKNILVGVLGLLIGIGLVVLLLAVGFLKEKVWIPSRPPPPHPRNAPRLN